MQEDKKKYIYMGLAGVGLLILLISAVLIFFSSNQTKEYESAREKIRRSLTLIEEYDTKGDSPEEQYDNILSTIKDIEREINGVKCQKVDSVYKEECLLVQEKVAEWRNVTEKASDWEIFGRTLPKTEEEKDELYTWGELQQEITNLVGE